MKTLFVGFDNETGALALVAQEGNRWYSARGFPDDGVKWVQWPQGQKPEFELTPIRDIPTPPRTQTE